MSLIPWKELAKRRAGDGAALGQADDITPESYEAALFEDDRQDTPWVKGPPCDFGVVPPGPNRYKLRIADGRVYAGYLPVRPTGGNFTLDGPFRWGTKPMEFGDVTREQ